MQSQDKNRPPNNNYKVVHEPPKLEPFSGGWALDKFLEKWEASDLDIAVRRDLKLDLKPFIGQIVDMATQEILKWFETYRPDLHKRLKEKDGRAWLRKKVKEALTQS